jgi:hypothetical protein
MGFHGEMDEDMSDFYYGQRQPVTGDFPLRPQPPLSLSTVFQEVLGPNN